MEQNRGKIDKNSGELRTEVLIGKLKTLEKEIKNLKDNEGLSGLFKPIYEVVENIKMEFQQLVSEMESNERTHRETNDSMKDINDYLKTVTDQLEEARREAVENSRAKSVFLNNVSHEMRTPMNAILGYTRQLKITKEEEKRKDFLDIVEKNGEALLMLINDIIEISRLEVDKVKLQLEETGLSDFMDELSWVFKVRSDEKNIQFITQTDEELPAFVMMDRARMRQVLYNILGNAVKFTQEGFVSFVAMAEKTKEKDTINLIFEIEDTGMGIKKEEGENIFKAFEQQKDQDVNFGGIGLGLTISKKLIELMGGTIELMEKKGNGALFKVVLNNVQIAKPSQSKMDLHDHAFQPFDFKGTKIMLVDDDRNNMRLMREYLQMMNVEVLEACNGQECLDMLEKVSPEIIIMDIRMPVMNGIVATKKIKANKKTGHIPVIILSATAVLDDEDITRDEYESVITKPVHMNSLVAEIRKFLKK